MEVGFAFGEHFGFRCCEIRPCSGLVQFGCRAVEIGCDAEINCFICLRLPLEYFSMLSLQIDHASVKMKSKYKLPSSRLTTIRQFSGPL